jgi:hypothetical protein
MPFEDQDVSGGERTGVLKLLSSEQITEEIIQSKLRRK